ncbi:hypothetical protein ASE12_01460 [Aeromicrobium sp. Root236]|uniref:DUF3159 domain-containing protein n=1 Tax=Aeromicrobium sp. Root236 TaxID=1736498 RepID=UPI0006FB095D|nr:DUF3159 domain-containing protein [Aeromicrobium sp. Root236]KRC63547.1 hypothetical protein ASE12_01460 [Aeromicrobium sp. Root236]
MTDQAATVEAVVRSQLAKAFGGRRGIVEGAVPTALFTVSWIITHDLRTSLTISVGAAVLLLLVRVVQRSTIQFVFNALFGIGIAAFIASRTGEARDVFLPGILLNAGTGAIMIVSIAVGWPLVGFLIGSATGDPTAWHDDRGLVKLCTRLTWVLVTPNIIRVAIQGPLWATDHVALLGSAKLALGWPLYVASFAVMAWMLGRDRTPVEPDGA